MKKNICICCLLFLLTITGCGPKMSQEQKDDIQASKDITESIEKFNNAENMHIIITTTDGEYFDMNVSGTDFSGIYTYEFENEENTEYIYKRGDERLTYIPEMNNTYYSTTDAGDLAIKLKDELSFTSSATISEDIIENYQPMFSLKKNNDGSISYTNKGVISTYMKNSPVLIISKEKELIGYKDLEGNIYKIDKYNSSPLDYEFADCIQGSCMTTNY